MRCDIITATDASVVASISCSDDPIMYSVCAMVAEKVAAVAAPIDCCNAARCNQRGREY